MVGKGGRAIVLHMPNPIRKTRFTPSECQNRCFLATDLRSTGALLVLCLAALGCDRNIEPYQPGEESRQPDLARIFPGPPGGAGSAEAQGQNEGASPRGAVPPARAESPPVASATGGSAPIRGEFDLASELTLVRPAGGVLFVIARPQGATGGPPLAVLRIPSPEFPLAFTIGPENVMIPSMQFAGAISISARLDADGNAMTRGSGDISSATAEGLSPGAEGVRLVLSERG